MNIDIIIYSSNEIYKTNTFITFSVARPFGCAYLPFNSRLRVHVFASSEKRDYFPIYTWNWLTHVLNWLWYNIPMDNYSLSLVRVLHPLNILKTIINNSCIVKRRLNLINIIAIIIFPWEHRWASMILYTHRQFDKWINYRENSLGYIYIYIVIGILLHIQVWDREWRLTLELGHLWINFNFIRIIQIVLQFV